MRVIHYHNGSEEEKFSSSIFKNTLLTLFYGWKLDALEIHISSKDGVKLVGNCGKIFINRNNEFIRAKDELGIKAVFLERIMELILLSNGIEIEAKNKVEKIAKEFLIDRLLVKNFSEIVFHKNLVELSKLEMSEPIEWFKGNLWCMVFHRVDEWSKEYLRKIIEKKNVRKFPILFDKIEQILSEFDESIKTEEDFRKAIKKITRIYGKVEK